MGANNNGGVAVAARLHPFFTAPQGLPKSNTETAAPFTPEPSCNPITDESNDPTTDTGNTTDKSDSNSKRKPKRRKTDTPTDTTPDASRGPKAKRRSRASTGNSILNHFGQKTEDGGQVDVRPGDDEQQQKPECTSEQNCPPLPSNETPDPVTSDTMKDKNQGEEATSKPLKLLKFNPKTGTIGSPPKPKPSPSHVPADSTTPTATGKRGRPRKTLLISIHYGGDDQVRERIGQHIHNILLGQCRHTTHNTSKMTTSTPPSTSQEVKTTTPKKRRPKKSMTPKKPTHPFFQGKSKADAAVPEEEQKDERKPPPKRHTIFTSTPCSPRRARAPPPKFNMPHFGSKAAGLKVPGAQHPAWPWSGAVHIRGDTSQYPTDGAKPSSAIVARARKAKRHEVQLSEEESIMHHITLDLDVREKVEELKSINNDDFRPISPLVRIPIRSFESGMKLQKRVLGELRTWTGAHSATKTHPAIAQAYASISTSLSAFDRATCETTAWPQKYAPPSADHIVQHGPEAELLRNWLQTLKVQAVHTGQLDVGPKSKMATPAKKTRKRKKLDGFVVSSDDEADEMNELSESEKDWSPNGSRGISKKTVLRSGGTTSRGSKDTTRLTNAVVISGPHGCGKTATVHAIAKELDFEIFEINAGARRSGKDILEKVGDMTRNHLVQHHQKEVEDEDAEDEVTRDLKSGKQGTMTSFFKLKPTKVDKSKKLVQAPAAEPTKPKDVKKPSNSQKQSLILLEEVDILYEEDKQFWATVISLISQSKRPFIMTCNDETLVPLQALTLHGIFRFSAPPKEMAVDLLLLIAANEGHALRRHPIETLYDSRGHDLRASITELNYWCQIGVGDMRGGFDWFYPRWPKGSDVDEKGNTIRVVSQDTYHAGMGWLSRDATVATSSSTCSSEEELQRQTWNCWGLDILDSSKSNDFTSWAEKCASQSAAEDRLALVNSLDAFAEFMSDADICGPHLDASSNQVILDPGSPNIPAKNKDDFIVGRQLLEATPLHNYHTTAMDISTSLRRLARARLQADRSCPGTKPPFQGIDESQAVKTIEQHLDHTLHVELPTSRVDYGLAFDPIAASEKTLAGGPLEPSVFERTMTTISLDVAPYVRSIVAFDQRLQQQRRIRSNLLSEGGQPAKKRSRTTRSAYSALEGGSRASTRRENYFSADMNTHLVMRTGGKGWDELTRQLVEGQSPASSCD
ncbi:Uu.00g078980.m01.CDS01 [Anthostomella pinea]|uniref:Uu.00g078980.m01.CDS01 n=1 Tax=Anthostomella pinea TaxID=933095 RepID=A0AAI8VLC6_9PEZI|nr:Uu.00g078980.m01.CDS01 [Anthostomella pinea]